MLGQDKKHINDMYLEEDIFVNYIIVDAKMSVNTSIYHSLTKHLLMELNQNARCESHNTPEPSFHERDFCSSYIRTRCGKVSFAFTYFGT